MKKKTVKKAGFAETMKRAGITNRLMRRVTMRLQLDEVQGFVTTIEAGFKKELKASEKRWAETPEELDEDQFHVYFQKLSREQSLLRMRFPELIRRTTFIHLYSILEKGLTSLCERVQNCDPTLPLIDDDRKNKGIVRTQKYLKSAKIKFPDNTPDWEELRRMGDLRNRFVHSTGKASPKPLAEYLKKRKDLISVGPKDGVTLKENYCPHAIEVVRRFYQAVLDAIPDELLEAK